VNTAVAFVGVGQTEFARAIPGKSRLRLEVEAASAAVRDAGLKMSDIDGVLIWNDGNSSDKPRYHIQFSEHLGIYEKGICLSTLCSGASAGISVELARWALQSGRCNYVLAVGSMKGSEHYRARRMPGLAGRLVDVGAVDVPVFSDGAGERGQNPHSKEFDQPFGVFGAPTHYGAVARRHMHEFGTTIEQISAVAVAHRHNASLNPDAVYRKPITVKDVLASDVVASPLHMYHCCIISDGAVAFVMTTAERARDLPNPPVYIRGMGSGHSGYSLDFLSQRREGEPHPLVGTLARRAAGSALEESGVTHDEIDFVTCLDNFAISPIILLEDFGFCDKGEGGDFVGNGDRIKVGGSLPVNPHGGALSCNHAGIGYQYFTEAVTQLRHSAGARQIPDARRAFVHSGAGVVSTHTVAILGTD
jgi:acetyl-CoA acetyltransferase